MLFFKLKWYFLVIISLITSECYSQDKIHFYKGEVLEVKILEVDTDSITFLSKPGKKHELQSTISNKDVSYLEYKNGDRDFITRDIIYLQDKVKLVTILEIGDDFITYIDLLDKYYDKPKVLNKKKIVSISLKNGEELRFYDVIYLSDKKLIIGHVHEVDVNKIIYTNIEDIRDEINLTKVNRIVFKNGSEQNFAN